jgi:hypothetical protein
MANLDSIIQNLGSASETEVDGHRVKLRSVEELRQLKDLQDELDSAEVGDVKKAGFKVQAFNNGTGLI